MQVSKITIDASALAKKLCVGFAFFAVPTYYSRNAKEQGNRETLILHMTIAKTGLLDSHKWRKIPTHQ